MQVAGDAQPHPNCGCVLVGAQGGTVGAAATRAAGTRPAEALAVEAAGEAARGATAYVNLEPDCSELASGLDEGVRALVQAGVARVVVGLRHPMPHASGRAVAALREQGVRVDVLGECAAQRDAEAVLEEARYACLEANEALCYRAATGRPFSVLKYAMTLDGKIATAAGHAAWVSSSEARERVLQVRRRSDAIIVGGNTLRRDDPRLTTRLAEGNQPYRVVLSRTMDLPDSCNLWDVSQAPTMVMTQRGARPELKRSLQARGVEVIEFDILTPAVVAQYCGHRGFLQCLWECGGTLAAPALSDGVIDKVLAFVAPKIIGGPTQPGVKHAPSPVGDLGNVMMGQAIELLQPRYEQVGPDIAVSGYLKEAAPPASKAGLFNASPTTAAPAKSGGGGGGSNNIAANPLDLPTSMIDAWGVLPQTAAGAQVALLSLADAPVIEFYKGWQNEHGVLSNFSAHPIVMPDGVYCDGNRKCGGEGGLSCVDDPAGGRTTWPCAEHFYQAQKFAGVEGDEARELRAAILRAPSPEAAAGLARRAERERPHLRRRDWSTTKVSVMRSALMAKFTQHEGPRELLLSTLQPRPAVLVEASPHDTYWGGGRDGRGSNHLGRLLMELRAELCRRPVLGVGRGGGGGGDDGDEAREQEIHTAG